MHGDIILRRIDRALTPAASNAMEGIRVADKPTD
jgi:hypothetical protein